jgi:hypothetical protein
MTAEVEEGGETSLPLATPIDEAAQRPENMSPCASWGGIAVRPRKGDVLLFYDMDIAGGVGDRKSLHAACPATKVSCIIAMMSKVGVSGRRWMYGKALQSAVYVRQYRVLFTIWMSPGSPWIGIHGDHGDHA